MNAFIICGERVLFLLIHFHLQNPYTASTLSYLNDFRSNINLSLLARVLTSNKAILAAGTGKALPNGPERISSVFDFDGI
jgi:hypothetical protein